MLEEMKSPVETRYEVTRKQLERPAEQMLRLEDVGRGGLPISRLMGYGRIGEIDRKSRQHQGPHSWQYAL